METVLSFKKKLYDTDDMNDVLETGYYYFLTADGVPENSAYQNSSIIEVLNVLNNTDSQIIQKMTRYAITGETAYRTLSAGVWSPWQRYQVSVELDHDEDKWTVLYVSPDGDDFGGNGSSENPFKSITKAIALNSNKMIQIQLKPGVYNVGLLYITSSSMVRIYGNTSSPEDYIISGNISCRSNGCHISGVTIEFNHDSYDYAMHCYNCNIIIQYCKFICTSTTSTQTNPRVLNLYASQASIENSTFIGPENLSYNVNCICAYDSSVFGTIANTFQYFKYCIYSTLCLWINKGSDTCTDSTNLYYMNATPIIPSTNVAVNEDRTTYKQLRNIMAGTSTPSSTTDLNNGEMYMKYS